MKNHLIKCEAYLNSHDTREPVFQLAMEGPIAPDSTPTHHSMVQHHMQPPPTPDNLNNGTPGPSQDPNASVASMGGMMAPSVNMGPGPSGPQDPVSQAAAQNPKTAQQSLEKIRQAMGRSTKRLEQLEAVLTTQVKDGMHNAATHVRAAIRDERDRLFKLSQTLVKQETRLREIQSTMTTY